MKEQILEPLLRKLRIKRVLPFLQQKHDCNLLDIGCGWNAKFLQEIAPYIAHGTGIDFKAPPNTTLPDKIKTIAIPLHKELPFESNMFDIVTMMAVLEHLEHPTEILAETHRVLKPGGIFLGTVPSKAAKPVLEFLAFRLGIVNPDEIRDHKQYHNRSSLVASLQNAQFQNITHRYFQCGMNNFFLATK